MVARAACVSRPEGSTWTGQSRELVKPYPLTLYGKVIECSVISMPKKPLIIFLDRVVWTDKYNFNPNQS